jgi:hypothetical protein
MKLSHFALNIRQQILGMLLGFFMIIISFKVEQVSLKIVFCFFNFLLLLHKLIIFLKLFKLVTVPITSCMLAVLHPVAKTYPTELIPARSASHMNATLIFLNLSLTFGTCFRVCENPLQIWTLSVVFLFPLLCAFTVVKDLSISSDQTNI